MDSPEQQDVIQFLQDNIFSMLEDSSVKTKNYGPHFHRGSNTDPTSFLFDYSIISNIAFKEMLLTETTPDTTRINLFVEPWNNEETWTFTQQLTQLINQLNYLKLQDEQWAYYYHLGITEGIWAGRVSKRMARDNSMCYTYGRSKHIIEQRRKKFQRQLKQIQSDIDQHMAQTTIPLCDLNAIKNIVTAIVAKNQFPLRVEFDRRRAMLRLDAKDHQCIQAFYALQPSQTQVRINLSSIEPTYEKTLYRQIRTAKYIWKAIHDEHTLRNEIAICKPWLHTKLSMSIDCYTSPGLPLIKIGRILTKLILDQTPSTASLRLSVDDKYSTIPGIPSDELLRQAMSIAEDRAETHALNAEKRRTKAFKNRGLAQSSECDHQILVAIEHRQATTVERAQYQTQQSLEFNSRKQLKTVNSE